MQSQSKIPFIISLNWMRPSHITILKDQLKILISSLVLIINKFQNPQEFYRKENRKTERKAVSPILEFSRNLSSSTTLPLQALGLLSTRIIKLAFRRTISLYHLLQENWRQRRSKWTKTWKGKTSTWKLSLLRPTLKHSRQSEIQSKSKTKRTTRASPNQLLTMLNIPLRALINTRNRINQK